MARKKHAKPHEEEAGEAWLLPYSDLMTLLLALFIALFAMSQTDSSKMQALAQAFTAAFNMGGPSFFSGMGPSMSMPSTPSSGAESSNSAYMEENENLREAQEKLEQYIKENNLEDQVSTELTEDGLMIRLKEKALFASGSCAVSWAHSHHSIPRGSVRWATVNIVRLHRMIRRRGVRRIVVLRSSLRAACASARTTRSALLTGR